MSMSATTTTNTANKKGRPRNNPPNTTQIGATYESVYQCLKRLNNLTLPQSMNRISTNANVKIFLVKHKLIKEVNADHNLRAEYLTCRYYSIDTKGQDYLKRYECFKELITN